MAASRFSRSPSSVCRSKKCSVEVIQRIISGGESVCAQAGIPIAAAIPSTRSNRSTPRGARSRCTRRKVKRNDRARSGDVLILGKPLGVGILSAAFEKGKLSASGYKQMVEITTQLKPPGTALAEPGRCSRADGTSPASSRGHLLEICRGSKLGAEIRFDDLPVLAEPSNGKGGHGNRGVDRNWKGYGHEVRSRRARRTGSASSSAIRRRAGGCSWLALLQRKNA